MNGYIALDYTDLAVAAILLVISGALTVWLKLGIARSLLISSVRTGAQLTLLGFVLKLLFENVSPLWTGLAVLLMVTVAAHEIRARQTTTFKGFWAYGLGTTSLVIAAMVVTLLALTTQISPDPWYHPRFALPILGMVMGNTMTGIAVGLDRMLGTAKREKNAIEARLALGATWQQAFNPLIRESFRAGTISIINAMATAGLVSIPGMMTGQVLSGMDPVEASKYQILIMFLIAGSTIFGVLMAVYLTAFRLTDQRHRLRLDRLQTNGR